MANMYMERHADLACDEKIFRLSRKRSAEAWVEEDPELTHK